MVFLKVIPDNENVSKSFQKSLEGTVYVIGCRKLHFSCWTRFYEDSGRFCGNSGISCFWRWSPILGESWFEVGMTELNWNSKEGQIGTGSVFFWLYFENDVWEGGTVLVAKWGGWEMPEIKKSWLTFYGLSDHDFPIKWMFRLRRSEGFSGWFPISPSSALRAPSPSREKISLRFLETVNSATPGKPFVQNDMGVGWEWKKKPIR